MSKNRRRSRTQQPEPVAASVSLPAVVAELPTVDLSRNRRRPRRAPEAAVSLEPPPLPAEEQAPARAARRRSYRGADEPVSMAEDKQPQPVTGALSGQLPPGTVREPGVIATEAGRYLRQAARDDAPSRFGSPDGAVDTSARHVWEIAFGLAVRRRFEPETPLAEISRTVSMAVHEHAAAALPVLDAEMLVRSALGETVPTGGIDGGVLVGVHLLLFASLVDELALGDTELEALIAEAEQSAAPTG